MTRNRALALLGSCVILWACYVMLAGRKQQRLAVELARRDRSAGAPLASTNPAANQSDMVRLSESVIAEWSGENWWIVHDDSDHLTVTLPFEPHASGEIPEGAATTRQIASNNPGYVGATACRECHREKHDGFVDTSHFRTTRPATADAIAGSLSPPTNVLGSQADALHYAVQQKDGRWYQQVTFHDWQLDVPMDIVTGSNKSGQSYLYWHGDALFQDYVSHLAVTDQWIVSPGFSSDDGNFTRPIRAQCLECHVTFIDRTKPPNHFDRDSVIWGVTCERCHGPGQQHVEYHRNHPQQREPRFVVNPNDLPRDRQLDICGQCHSGAFQLRSAAFTYQPGTDLMEHHKPKSETTTGVGSVHTANQLDRLRRSECFRQSEMTCATCHDPHQYQRGNIALFSQRCQDCHQPPECGMHEQLQDRLADNCIDCHMPTGDNEGMDIETSAGKFKPPMIDHYIRVDRQATDRFLNR